MTFPARSAFRVAARAALVAFVLGAFYAIPVARADEGDDEGEALSAKIKAQMEKIVRLMRENEKALLQASLGGGKTTKPVDVTPPEPNSGVKPPTPPPPGMEGEAGGEAPPPGGTGEDIRRRMAELIEGLGERGQTIPGELEELVRMIPQSQGQGGSPDSQDPSGKPLPSPDDAEARKAGETPENAKEQKSGAEKDKDPKAPTGERAGTSDKPPGGGETDEAKRDGVPAWITELPREIRQMLTSGETDKIPSPFKEQIQAYLDSLRKKAKDSGR